MKELSIENKAKRYDELIAMAKECITYIPDETVNKYILNIFPELKESEDEKTRKEIVRFIQMEIEDEIIGNKWIAWIRKQGKNRSLPKFTFDDVFSLQRCIGIAKKVQEDKELYQQLQSLHTRLLEAINDEPIDNANKVEPKFKVDDWIISYNGKSIYQVIEVKRYIYVIRDNADNKEYSISIEQCEKSGRLWTIEDAKNGDILDANGAPFIYKKHDKDTAYFYCGVNLADEFIVANEIDTWNINRIVYPATNEQCVLLFSKMLESGYAWDEKKLKLKKISSGNEL